MKSCISNVNEVCVWKCIRWSTAVLSEGFCLTDQPGAVILFRPNRIFMFTKEVQESEVYSDLEKINPIFQNDRSTCGGFILCAENSVLGWISKGKSMPIWNACLQNKTLKNWVMCLLNHFNTAKRYFHSRLSIIYMHKLKDNVFLNLYRWDNHLALHIWEQK